MPRPEECLRLPGAAALVVAAAVVATVAPAQTLSRPQRASLAGVTVTAVRTDVAGSRQEVLATSVPGFRVPPGSAPVKRLVEADSRLELRLSAITGGGAAGGAVLLSLLNASGTPLAVASTEPACCGSLAAWGISSGLPQELRPGETVPVVALTLDELRRSGEVPFAGVLDSGQRYNWRLEVVWDEAALRRPTGPPPSPSVTLGPGRAPEPAPTSVAATEPRKESPAVLGGAVAPTLGTTTSVPDARSAAAGVAGGGSRVEAGGTGSLTGAARAYLGADYAGAISLLDPAKLEAPRVRAVGLLLRAAARYSLYLEGGRRNATLEAQAAEDARACFRLEPDLAVDARVLSPPVWELIRGARERGR